MLALGSITIAFLPWSFSYARSAKPLLEQHEVNILPPAVRMNDGLQ